MIQTCDIRLVNVPKYSEFTLEKLYDMLKNEPETLKYLQDLRKPPHKAPDRGYCFNIVNTLNPGYFEEAVRHAIKSRCTFKPPDEKH